MPSPHPSPDLAELFASFGRELLLEAAAPGDVLALITRRSLDAVPSAEHAGITRRAQNGRFDTVAPTSDTVCLVDHVQYELASGPCVAAVRDGGVHRAGDLEHDDRWPEFGRRVAESYDIHSMLTTRLCLEDDDRVASLNLYSSRLDAFDGDDQTVATLLATHGALALTAAKREAKNANLTIALTTSRQIGTAVGILMAGLKVTDDQAFDLLRRASQTSHRKLADIAFEVNRTGALELPEFGRRPLRVTGPRSGS